MNVEKSSVRAHVDWFLILMVMGMSIFGVYAVSVATFPTDSSAQTLLEHVMESSSAIRQCFFLVLGPVILAVVTLFPYRWLRDRRLIVGLYVGSTALVFLVAIFNRAEGVKAWLDVIWGMTIQPSEFIKITMILMLAHELSKSNRPMSNLPEFVRIMMIVGIPAVIILGSGEAGSLIVIIFLFAVMLFFSNVDMKLLLTLAAIAVIGLLSLYGVMVMTGSDDYRLARILAFINPELSPLGDAYQMRQSQIAIGSGGLTGIGAYQNGAISQLNYVPADWTDFIFSTIGEAWGFRGCIIILAGYLIIILRMLYLAHNTRDRYGMLVIIGVVGMLLFHVFENIGMALGLMPITGIPLPFLSYGGSNMVTNMGAVGLVLNVTKNRTLAGGYDASNAQVKRFIQYRYLHRR